MASLCGQAHCHGPGRRSAGAPRHIDGADSCSTSSSRQLRRCSASALRSPALPLLRTSSYLLLRPPHLSRTTLRLHGLPSFFARRYTRCTTMNSPHTSHDSPHLHRAHPLSTPQVDSMLNAIKWDKNGLVVAIAQHVNTGAILMQGFANCDAVSATIASGRATFYSRSRSSLWTKGETSSNFINVKDVFLDCDRDSIIYLGLPDGPTCHTGAETCYFTPASSFSNEDQNASERSALTTLYSLEETISKRRDSLLGQSVSGSYAKPSWTHKLLKDHSLLCSKIREEADELCRTLENSEGKERAASEMADVLYHSMVLLAVQDVKLEDVIEVLRARFSQSGIEEKNSRTTKS